MHRRARHLEPEGRAFKRGEPASPFRWYRAAAGNDAVCAAVVTEEVPQPEVRMVPAPLPWVYGPDV